MTSVINENYDLVNDMIMNAPIVMNATAANMLGRMLLIQTLLPTLCINDHVFDVACRYSHRISLAVSDAVEFYAQTLKGEWGTAF